MILRPSPTQVLRAAEKAILHNRQVKHQPHVVWQNPHESLADLDARLLVLRDRLPSNTLLLAVVAPHPNKIEGVTLAEMTAPMLDCVHPGHPERYRVAHSGRGAGKSYGFGKQLIAIAVARPTRILCLREFQMSIAESVHQLLSNEIEALGLSNWFDITQTSISAFNGSEFIFMGVHNNVTKVKSTEGVDIAYAEEAQTFSAESWSVVRPTIRKSGSLIFISFNPDQPDDPTYKNFVLSPPPSCRIVKTSWRDNPWLSAEMIAEKDYLMSVDPDGAAWVWEGECRTASDAQILVGKFIVEEFYVSPW